MPLGVLTTTDRPYSLFINSLSPASTSLSTPSPRLPRAPPSSSSISVTPPSSAKALSQLLPAPRRLIFRCSISLRLSFFSFSTDTQ